jgi:hypothetical protein
VIRRVNASCADRRIAAALLAAISLCLAACTDAGPANDIPSSADIEQPGPTDPSAQTQTQGDDDGTGRPPASSASPDAPKATLTGSQQERAEALYSCLSDKGFKAILDDVRPGHPEVRIEADNPEDTVTQVTAEGMNMYWSPGGLAIPADGMSTDAEAFQAWLAKATEAAQESPFGYVLYVGDVDRTADFAPCLEESGYVFPGVDMLDPEVQLESKREGAEVANDWAACARANGVPDVRDAEVSEDLWPVALLPRGVTEGQIRRLLEDCPPFDPAVADSNELAFADGRDDDQKSQPAIGFDVEGYREQDERAPSPEDEAIYQPLYELLWSARSAYFGARPDPDEG